MNKYSDNVKSCKALISPAYPCTRLALALAIPTPTPPLPFPHLPLPSFPLALHIINYVTGGGGGGVLGIYIGGGVPWHTKNGGS